MQPEDFNKQLETLIRRYCEENGQAIMFIDVDWTTATKMNGGIIANFGSINIESLIVCTKESASM
jgi:hypothetical protein